MEKTITIDGKDIRFKTNGATPLRYKAQFGKDYFQEILKMASLEKLKDGSTDVEVKDLENLDFQVFYNIAWIMAKTATPEIPEPMAWFESFEEFPIGEILPELQEMMASSLASTKKKLGKTAATRKK